jgi:hypothetical protein
VGADVGAWVGADVGAYVGAIICTDVGAAVGGQSPSVRLYSQQFQSGSATGQRYVLLDVWGTLGQHSLPLHVEAL